MSVSRCSAETRLFSSTFVSIFETRSTPRSARAGRAVRCGPNMAGWRSGRVWRRTSRRRRWLAGELERTRSWRFAWSDWTRGPSAKETDYDERRRSLGWRECPCWSLDRTAIASVFHCNNAPDSKNAVKITFIFHDSLRSFRLRLRQQGAAGGSRGQPDATCMTDDPITTESCNVTDEGGGRGIMASRCQAPSKDAQYRLKQTLQHTNTELARQSWQKINK